MTQAADNLYTTQPNLSKAVKKLEADLGMAIFKRTPKGLLPTKQGADFWSGPARFWNRWTSWRPATARGRPSASPLA